MALKTISDGLYGIVIPGGVVAPPKEPNFSANGAVTVEATNVTSLNRFDGDAAGVIVDNGCRMMLDNAEAPGFVFNQTVAEIITALS